MFKSIKFKVNVTLESDGAECDSFHSWNPTGNDKDDQQSWPNQVRIAVSVMTFEYIKSMKETVRLELSSALNLDKNISKNLKIILSVRDKEAFYQLLDKTLIRDVLDGEQLIYCRAILYCN